VAIARVLTWLSLIGVVALVVTEARALPVRNVWTASGDALPGVLSGATIEFAVVVDSRAIGTVFANALIERTTFGDLPLGSLSVEVIVKDAGELNGVYTADSGVLDYLDFLNPATSELITANNGLPVAIGEATFFFSGQAFFPPDTLAVTTPLSVLTRVPPGLSLATLFIANHDLEGVDVRGSFSIVPEPSTFLLVGCGFVALLYQRPGGCAAPRGKGSV